jgi:hypothetical protein
MFDSVEAFFTFFAVLLAAFYFFTQRKNDATNDKVVSGTPVEPTARSRVQPDLAPQTPQQEELKNDESDYEGHPVKEADDSDGDGDGCDSEELVGERSDDDGESDDESDDDSEEDCDLARVQPVPPMVAPLKIPIQKVRPIFKMFFQHHFFWDQILNFFFGPKFFSHLSLSLSLSLISSYRISPPFLGSNLASTWSMLSVWHLQTKVPALLGFCLVNPSFHKYCHFSI